MDYKNHEYSELPFNQMRIPGEVQEVELLCPGVYYFAVKQPDDLYSTEYYAAMRDTPVLSAEAKAYGKALPGCPEMLLYSLHQPDSGQDVVRYELFRYYVQNNIPLPDGYSLHSAALSGMEHHPEYFGTYPVPPLTPFGRTVRHRSLTNGICWLETDRALQALSVAYPLWEDLSDTAQGLAELLPDDREQGIENTLGYLFFSERTSCVPLFELCESHKEWITDGLIDYAALMNAVWQSFPDYAAIVNSREQAGVNDISAMLLRDLGVDSEPNVCPDRLLSISPGAGTRFQAFQREPAPGKGKRGQGTCLNR